MDPDPVLRSLGEDLARDDPRLAALLSGEGPLRRHSGLRTAVAVALALVIVPLALLLPPTVVVGVTAMVLAVSSPLLVCWLCAGDRPAPRLR